MACRVFRIDLSGFDNSDVKVTRCGWCPDFFNPDPAHHPGGQVEHVEHPAPAALECPEAAEGQR